MRIFVLRTTHPRRRVSLTHLWDRTPGVIDMTITRWKVFFSKLDNEADRGQTRGIIYIWS